MKPMQALCAAVVLLSLLPAVARAADDPEAVYAKMHQAMRANQAEELLGFASAKQKAVLAATPKAQRDGVIAFMSKLAPQTYRITGKSIAPDGTSAQLQAEGRGGLGGDGAMYLDAVFVMEAGTWKVDKWGWNSDKPPAMAMMGQARPAATPAAAKPKSAESAPAPARKKAALAAAPPVETKPQMGVSRPECVYKPVMTDDDMLACGIGAR